VLSVKASFFFSKFNVGGGGRAGVGGGGGGLKGAKGIDGEVLKQILNQQARFMLCVRSGCAYDPRNILCVYLSNVCS